MPIAWASQPTLPTRPPYPRGLISRELPTKSSSSTTSWIVWLEASKPIPYPLSGPSTQDLHAPNTFMPPRSISILTREPIAFIENSSNKMGEFSLIKIDAMSIHLFPYIKDKVTMDNSLNHGDDLLKQSLSETNWNDFKEPLLVLWFPTFSSHTLGKIYPMATSVTMKSRQNLFVWALGMNYGPTLPPMLSINWTTSLVSWRKSKIRNLSRSTSTRIGMLNPSLLPHQTTPLVQWP